VTELPAATTTRPDALLLDLGGVVVDIDFDLVFQRWAAQSGAPVEVIRERWSMDEPYERHERAEIDLATYFEGLRETLGVDLTDDQLLEGWNAVFIGLIPGVVELLDELADAVPLYLLTNTNPTHAEHWTTHYGESLEQFTARFLSSDLGLRKPDPAVFTHVAAEIGVPVERIHFFDDSRSNVEGALAAGMPATLVTSFDQFAAAARALVAPDVAS